jgi:UDP-N-acetylmuramoyl-L-alanyl-D-glutamate--2,6-diaminopimelate ligase
MELRRLAPAAKGMTADSRRVGPGDVFLAFPGDVHDGRQYIASAVAAGAAAVVWEPEGYQWEVGPGVLGRPLPGLRGQAARLAAAWWQDPSRGLWMVGVTGTNGKTSCSHWLAEAFTRLGRRSALIGTLGNGFAEALAGTSHTTPDAVTLQGLLAKFRDVGAAGVAMEVSSHALDQGRVEGVHFDVAVLTNLSRDHLDYHGDMAAYAHAKARLFAWPGLKWAILNADDELGRSLLADLRGGPVRVLSYGLGEGDVRAIGLRASAAGLSLDITTPWGQGHLDSPLVGEFNACNLLACLAVLLASEVPLADALTALAAVQPVPGRMQRLGGGGRPTVIIDYAHTPDALEKALKTLRPLAAGRLCCVFGCGGGRDKGKRPLMGGIAAALADQAIVTSDNPRHEDPAEIVAEILAGMPPGQVCILDRAEAISAAIAQANAGDVVLLAGKGHEDYQEIRGERLPFSDLEVAGRALASWKEAGHAAL